MAQLSYVMVVALFAGLQPISCLDNGLAPKPPMGWMSWQRYRCTTDCELYPNECISEWLFRNVTNLLVSEGYAEAGYEYVIIDDCWLARTRDDNGKLQPDPKRFPSGIRALADYIHSKGLKFGMYTDIGTNTCGGYPGSKGHFAMDTRTFAEWDVDYIKVDGCYTNGMNIDEAYPEFGKYLNQTGRPIVYSCSWPAYQMEQPNVDWKSISEHCNLWRLYGDIDDSYGILWNIMSYFGRRNDLVQYAGPGHWNDPDMLIIGNFGLSVWQAEAQMAVWAVLAAPLIMSNDLAHVKPEFKAILQNKRVIHINQDPLGIQGKRILSSHDIHVWSRPISPKQQNYFSYAIAFVSNHTDGMPRRYNSTLNDLDLRNPSGYIVHDLFKSSHSTYSGQTLMPTSEVVVRVNPTGVVFLHFRAKSAEISAETSAEISAPTPASNSTEDTSTGDTSPQSKSPTGGASSRNISLELMFITLLMLALQITF